MTNREEYQKLAKDIYFELLKTGNFNFDYLSGMALQAASKFIEQRDKFYSDAEKEEAKAWATEVCREPKFKTDDLVRILAGEYQGCAAKIREVLPRTCLAHYLTYKIAIGIDGEGQELCCREDGLEAETLDGWRY